MITILPIIKTKMPPKPELIISAMVSKAKYKPAWFKAKAPTLTKEMVFDKNDRIVSTTPNPASA